MVQRLVDLVDHNDAEHEHFAIALEDPSALCTGQVASPKQDIEFPTVDSFSAPIAYGFETVQFAPYSIQLLPIGDRDPIPDSDVDDRFSVFIHNHRPMSTVEDLAILENVPGI